MTSSQERETSPRNPSNGIGDKKKHWINITLWYAPVQRAHPQLETGRWAAGRFLRGLSSKGGRCLPCVFGWKAETKDRWAKSAEQEALGEKRRHAKNTMKNASGKNGPASLLFESADDIRRASCRVAAPGGWLRSLIHFYSSDLWWSFVLHELLWFWFDDCVLLIIFNITKTRKPVANGKRNMNRITGRHQPMITK